MKNIIFILILIFILIILYLINNRYIVQHLNLKIDKNEAKSRRFGLIIDVRTLKEREYQGYYPNSIPIPIDKLTYEVPLDISSKDTSILVYSNADDRAKKGAEILYNMGYHNVKYIDVSYTQLLPGSN
jgi:rhodanese-related sulfurtransferase